MISASTQQIISLYEDAGLDCAQIAEQMEADETAIKATLLQFSSKYQNDVKANKDDSSIGFSAEQHALAVQGIYNIAMGAEDENLRFRALKFVRDDAKGRRDINKVKDVKVNFTLIQQMINRAGRVLEQSRQEHRVIDIPEQERKLIHGV